VRRGWRIGRLGRIPLYVDPSLVLVFGLIAWSLASAYLPVQLPGLSPLWRWTLALLVTLLFFASILAHELAHGGMARVRQVPVLGITLSFIGGVAWLGDEPGTPFDEILITVVGPIASLIIGGLSLMVYAISAVVLQGLMPAGTLRQLLESLAVSGWYLGQVNVLLAVFNLLPTFPLDGGRLVHGLLWALGGRRDRALAWSVRFGEGVAALLVLTSLLVSLWARDPMIVVWGAVVAWVLYRTARRSLAHQQLRHRLAKVAVDSLMERNFPHVPPHLTLDVVAEQLLTQHRVALIPVTNGRYLLGVLLPAAVQRVPHPSRRHLTASTVMRPASDLPRLAPHDDADRALRLMAGAELAALPVVLAPATGTAPVELVGLLEQRTLLALLHDPPSR